MKYPKVLKASKSQQIDAVIENLPVNANGFFLDEAQMTAIEGSLAQAEADAAALATANTSLTEAQAQVTALTTERDTANASLATANENIAALQAQVKTLGGKADPPGETKREKDPAPDPGKKQPLNSMDAYAEEMGLGRI